MSNVSQPKTWDAVVVGSGITGGWAAKELTERGLETLVLEAGRPVDPGRDYVEHVMPWQLRHRGGLAHDLQEEQSIQKECGACDGYTSKFFVNDRDNPYRVERERPFLWIRGRQVGGRSITWGRQCYRWGPLDFEANARDGAAIDWPIRYEDLAPFYDKVEEFAGISGREEGLPQLPDGRFLPPMAMHCPEVALGDAMRKSFGRSRVLTIGRTAILTRDHRGRAACHYCGPCARGCITRSYFSSLNATLPAAEQTRRLTLRPYSVVESVL